MTETNHFNEEQESILLSTSQEQTKKAYYLEHS